MYSNYKYRVRVIKNILAFTNDSKFYIIVSVILNLVLLIVNVITPQVYSIFIDDVVIGGAFSLFVNIIVYYLLLFFANVFSEYYLYINRIAFDNGILIKVKSKILDNVFNYSFTNYDTLDIGDIKLRIDQDTQQVSNFVESQAIKLAMSYVGGILYVILLLIIEWKLAIYSFMSIPFTILIDRFLSKRENELNESNRINDMNMNSWLSDSLVGWKEAKALNLSEMQTNTYNKYLNNYADYFRIWINYWTARVLVIPKIKDILLMQFGLYFIGGIMIINGVINIGDLLVFSLYYGYLSQAINNISSCDAELKANMPYTDRLMEELSVKFFDEEKNNVYESITNIKLENVTYSYAGNDENVLENISFRMDKGDRIAIVGKTGSGKSTLLKVLSGLLTPTSGEVYYNDVNVKKLDKESIWKKVSYILQNDTLYNTTIKNNLLYGNPDATEEMILAACEKVNILDFIKSLPDGLNTIVGERGIKLSSGQKQRVILARMLLRSSDVYILDEVTNNLDPQNEEIIHEALRNIDSEKIIIVVTHRPTVLKLCNRVYSIENKQLKLLHEMGVNE